MNTRIQETLESSLFSPNAAVIMTINFYQGIASLKLT